MYTQTAGRRHTDFYESFLQTKNTLTQTDMQLEADADLSGTSQYTSNLPTASSNFH
jgi:hypothetical protein